jgi:hypothetical protein
LNDIEPVGHHTGVLPGKKLNAAILFFIVQNLFPNHWRMFFSLFFLQKKKQNKTNHN